MSFYNPSFTKIASLQTNLNVGIYSNNSGSIVGVTSALTNALYLSNNYGKWFTPFTNTAIGTTYTYFSTFAASDTTYLYVGANNNNPNLFVSSNLGSTWTSYNVSAEINFLTCDSTGKYVAAAYQSDMTLDLGYLYVSTNYGTNFTQATTLSYVGICGASRDLTTIAAVKYGTATVYYSTNYGATYVASSGALPSTTYGILNWSNSPYQAMAVTNYGWFIVNPNRTSYIYATTNLGSSWFALTNSSSLTYSNISGNNTGQYLTAESGSSVYYSTSYGSYWSIAATYSGTSIVASYMNSIGNITYAISAQVSTGYQTIYYNPYLYIGGIISPPKFSTQFFLYVSSNVTTINPYTFSGLIYTGFVQIPTNVTSIGEGSFVGCINMNILSLPTTVTSIPNNSCFGCTSLSICTIPSVTSIGFMAFGGCISLTTIGSTYNTVTIPSTVKIIGDYSFTNCTSITKVTMTSPSSIGQSTFAGCSNLSSIILSSTSTGLPSYNSYQSGTTTYSTYWGIPSSTSITQN